MRNVDDRSMRNVGGDRLSRNADHARSARAQTTIDFAIGAGVFLLAVAFIIAFVPSMLSPYVGGSQEETVAADRIAGQLSKGMLAQPDRPYVLDTQCTVEFFSESQEFGQDRCRFNQSATPVTDRINVDERLRLNVELRSGDDRLHWDETEQRVTTEEADVAFVIGEDSPTDTGSVVVARRAVSIEGTSATLFVRVW